MFKSFTSLVLLFSTSQLLAFSAGELKSCKSQDAKWLKNLAHQVDNYYMANPEIIAKDKYKSLWRYSDTFNHFDNDISLMKHFDGLSRHHYNRKLFGEHNTELIRKSSLLKKWAPNFHIFKSDYKPVSISKLYDVSDIQIWSNSPPEIGREDDFEGILVSANGKQQPQRKKGKNEYFYTIKPKPWKTIDGVKGLRDIRATKLAKEAKNFDVEYLKNLANLEDGTMEQRLLAYKNLKKRILDDLDSQYSEFKKKLDAEIKIVTADRKKGLRALHHIFADRYGVDKTDKLKMKLLKKSEMKKRNYYKNDIEGHARQNLKERGIIGPDTFTPKEKQSFLAKFKTNYKQDIPHKRYLAMNKYETDSMARNLANEAHVYGVVREFKKKDGYKYASLQYHFFSLNSFLPLTLIPPSVGRWHDGDTEKCQIVLRKPANSSDKNYTFFGSECSQHYYGTSYPNDIFSQEQINGTKRLNNYVSLGSHASNFTPGFHGTAKNEKGPLIAQKMYNDEHLKLTFGDFFGLRKLGKLLTGVLVDRAPIPVNEEGVKNDDYYTFTPNFNNTFKIQDKKNLNSQYILHTNYPDNSWIWQGFTPNDKTLHLGGKSALPGGSGPPVPKFAMDIPGHSFFCNPIKHYFYYYRPGAELAKLSFKVGSEEDTIAFKVSTGKYFKALDDIQAKYPKLTDIITDLKKNYLDNGKILLKNLKKYKRNRKNIIDTQTRKVLLNLEILGDYQSLNEEEVVSAFDQIMRQSL